MATREPLISSHSVSLTPATVMTECPSRTSMAAGSIGTGFKIWMVNQLLGTRTFNVEFEDKSIQHIHMPLSEKYLQRDLDNAEQQRKEDSEEYVSDTNLNYKPDRTILGLASYATSSIFLASMLTCAKLLGRSTCQSLKPCLQEVPQL